MKKITNIINNNVDSLKYLYTADGSVSRDLHSGRQAVSQRLNNFNLSYINKINENKHLQKLVKECL